MDPKYPIYIISKGRWKNRLTSKAFEKMHIPYHIVIEPQELEQYSAVINPQNILVLPFSNLGQGSIPARNWIWEHSLGEGARRHWIVDDNIHSFMRINKNNRWKTSSGITFRACEDFTDRYNNIALSGMNYKMFVVKKNKKLPFTLNTRIYSCILINNKMLHRWRGRYNEDTDLSLRILKDGWCTILFNVFIIDKAVTMTMKGGNTEDLYEIEDGRLKMAQSLQRQHPDVTQIKKRWGRWQHVVDYRPFKGNRLIKKKGIIIPKGINNYGMILINKKEKNNEGSQSNAQ